MVGELVPFRRVQIRCDSVSCCGFDTGRQGYWFFQTVREYDEPDLGEARWQPIDQAHWQH